MAMDRTIDNPVQKRVRTRRASPLNGKRIKHNASINKDAAADLRNQSLPTHIPNSDDEFNIELTSLVSSRLVKVDLSLPLIRDKGETAPVFVAKV